MIYSLTFDHVIELFQCYLNIFFQISMNFNEFHSIPSHVLLIHICLHSKCHIKHLNASNLPNPRTNGSDAREYSRKTRHSTVQTPRNNSNQPWLASLIFRQRTARITIARTLFTMIESSANHSIRNLLYK